MEGIGFLIWVCSVVMGAIIGAQKDQMTPAFFLSILFGPLGVLIILCLPDKKAEAEQLLELESQRRFQREQLELQRDHLEEMRAISVPKIVSRPRMKPTAKIKLARNGQEWGDFSPATIRAMLANGDIMHGDYFWDSKISDWVTLDQLPD